MRFFRVQVRISDKTPWTTVRLESTVRDALFEKRSLIRLEDYVSANVRIQVLRWRGWVTI